MNITKTMIAGIVGLSALVMADHGSLSNPETWIGKAEARIGRPATPMSYAGVARRTTRRAVAVGAAASTGCRTVYDAYGRAVTTCY